MIATIETDGYVVFIHVIGEIVALLNRGPHESAPLKKVACVARLTWPVHEGNLSARPRHRGATPS